jgi:tricorn protease
MRKVLFAAVLVCLLSAFSMADEARMLRYPDIHQDKIAFTYGGDIWIVASEGGMARRLTSHDGMEIHPKFSPDGKWIAFTGQYDGNWDVYIMPAEGGQPKRLTYHPGMDRVVDWHPDGKHVVFRSIRESFSYRFNRHFKVSVEGTNPELMPLPEAELASFNADGSKVAYNRLAREFRTWKRYRGGTAQEVYIYDFKNNTQENITNDASTDAFPMWAGNTIYFLSDREENGRRNLYTYDMGSKEVAKVTNHSEWDVAWPSNGPEAIVYELGGWLRVLDLASGEDKQISVTIYDDKRFTRPELKSVTSFIHSFGISPQGKRAVFEARGEIFTVPAENGSIRKITNSPGAREGGVAWSPDGKHIAYYSDESGEFEIYIRPADGSGEAKKVTEGLKTYIQNISWSPDNKKIMFSTVDLRVHYVDVETGKITEVYWAEYSGAANFVGASWSPDSKWITYSKADPSGFGSIWLYSLDKNENYQVTSTLTSDVGPAFDPDMKYLFWIANREFNPGFSAFEFNYYFENPGKVVVATLQKDTPNPFAPESDEAVVKEEKKEEKAEEKKEGEENGKEAEKEDKAEDKKDEKKEDEGAKIDIEGINERMVNLPVPDGTYLGVIPFKQGIVIAKMGEGAELHLFDMKKKRDDANHRRHPGCSFLR